MICGSFFFPRISSDFASDYSFDVTLARLRSLLDNPESDSLFSSRLDGSATEDHIVLNRYVPMVGNLYRFHFRGILYQPKQGVIVSGHFVVSAWTEAVVRIWFGFAALIMIILVAAALFGDNTEWYAPLIGLVPIGVGLLTVQTGKQFSSQDVTFISQAVQRALTLPHNLPVTPPPAPSWLAMKSRWLARKYYSR